METLPHGTTYFLPSLHNAKPHSRSQTLSGVHSSALSAIHCSPSSSTLGIFRTPDSTCAFLELQNAQWNPPGMAQIPKRPGTCHHPAVVAEVLGLLKPFMDCKLDSMESIVLRNGLGATKHWQALDNPANGTVRSRVGALSRTYINRMLALGSRTRHSYFYCGLAPFGVSSSAWRILPSLLPSPPLWLSVVGAQNHLASHSY